MKFIAFAVLCVISSSLAFNLRNAAAKAAAEECPDTCTGSCQCSGTSSPIAVDSTPQLITLVYADAVTDYIYTEYLEPLISGRTNPDGAQIGLTFYVPHEYTDYERVNELYNLGMDIAVHSISRNSLSTYWQEATVDDLIDEYDGQRQILSRFANIPIEDIVGSKIPNLEMLGNNMFEAFVEAGLEYDNSWTAQSTSRYFPYTLDYLSTQPCQIGICPDESFPGFWEIPIVDLLSPAGLECNSLQGCAVSGTSSEIRDWFMEQFERVYNDNKAPITLVLSSGWFATSTSNLEGLHLFMDEVASLSDVFFVSHRQVMDWAKNPVATSSFATDVYYREQSCVARTCALSKGDEERYMKSCVACPTTYPWLGNPLGN